MTEPQRSAPQFGAILSKWKEKQSEYGEAASGKRSSNPQFRGSDRRLTSEVDETDHNRPSSFTCWKEREGSGSKFQESPKRFDHETQKQISADYVSPKPSDVRRKFDVSPSSAVPTMFSNKGLGQKPLVHAAMPNDTTPHSAPPAMKSKAETQPWARSHIKPMDEGIVEPKTDRMDTNKDTPSTPVSQKKSKSTLPSQEATKSLPEPPPAVENDRNIPKASTELPKSPKNKVDGSSLSQSHEHRKETSGKPAAPSKKASLVKRHESILRSRMSYRSANPKPSNKALDVCIEEDNEINRNASSQDDRLTLLRGISFLKDLPDDGLRKLASLMILTSFMKDQLLVKRGIVDENTFYIVQEGTVICKDITAGQSNYMDQILGPGEWFAEGSLIPTETRQMNIIAQSRGALYAIDKKILFSFTENSKELILKAEDSRRLAGMRCLQNANLNDRQFAALASVMSEKKFMQMQLIQAQGLKTKIAIYFVRKGEVEISTKGKTEVVKAGGFFGDTYFKDDGTFDASVYCQPSYSAKSLNTVVCGVLTLQDARTVFDTALLAEQSAMHESFNISFARIGTDADVEDLIKHTILGEGTFGQVWLVSEPQLTSKYHDAKPFALKIQSKYELAREGQIMAVMEEKKILAKIQHPFTCKLIKAFQDSVFVYLLMECVQGGELFSLLHDEEHNDKGFSDEQAKFYAFCLADVFAYIHQSKIAYRDLKPENVMIDHKGYPILIDFGFAKFVPDKTYTLCGTPGYLPPEVVTNCGHDCSADHWSLGILIYEMIAGTNPFYYEGMDQMSLFHGIVNDPVEKPTGCSSDAADIAMRLLVKDPTCRLGSLARGEREIKEHPWFESLNLNEIRHRRVAAPWVPDLKDAFDTSCFEDWSHLEDITTQEFEEITEREKAMFRGFEDDWDD